jgi:hypothetical protein
MFPQLELLASDVNRRAVDLTKSHVVLPDPELARGVTHRSASIATAARLMKQQRPVDRAELSNQLHGGLGDFDAFDCHADPEKD